MPLVLTVFKTSMYSLSITEWNFISVITLISHGSNIVYNFCVLRHYLAISLITKRVIMLNWSLPGGDYSAEAESPHATLQA